MYLDHFNFLTQPFTGATHQSGDFYIALHRDVYALMEEKSTTPGMIGLFADDEELLKTFTTKLHANSHDPQIINGFPELSAKTLLYKLNPVTSKAKSKIQAIDAVLYQWNAPTAEPQKTGKMLIIQAVQAMKDNCWEILGMLLTRAEELQQPLTIVLTGTPEQEKRLMRESGLAKYIHTHHTLHTPGARECKKYVHAQIIEHGAENSPFSPHVVAKISALAGGNVTTLNRLAHLTLLAAWTERAAQAGSRHVRLAAREILPPRRKTKRIAAGLLAILLCAAGGWFTTATLTASLPMPLPVPASWKHPVVQQTATTEPDINNEVINRPDAMHQLYKMWGYDATAEDALCQNASQVDMACKEGQASLASLEKEGYPWISELKNGNHINYAVVARVDSNSLDLLMNDHTWQVSRQWFEQHATGNYTLLHHLTPEGNHEVAADSHHQDISWIDEQLGTALQLSPTHVNSWSQELVKRTRDFQSQAGIHVDGIPGEDTLMQLMRFTHSTPVINTPANDISPATPATRKAL